MKRILFSLAFVVSIAGAWATNASKSLLLETAYTRNPNIANCVISQKQCAINGSVFCSVSTKQGYRLGCTQLLFEP